MRMTGKVAIVTGAAHGIGRAEAEALAREGARVVLADILDKEGRAAAEAINAALGEERALYQHLDVTSAGDWAAAIERAVAAFGPLTTLVNNAGFPGRPGVEETTEEGWEQTMAVDLKGTWLGMKLAIPQMRRAGGGGGGGAIVNTSSTYGLVASGRAVAYHSAKGGVIMLTKSAAVEYAKENIRVNCIHPGVVDTPRIATLPAEWKASLLATTPIGRMARPEEIAAGVLLLASDEASYITGTSLVIDGGFTAM
jgi:NAD(P)-dependent dehydrogenase (short-subunit alcohol dehydrogenase family)